MKVLVTGGAGHIGSHTYVELLEGRKESAGYVPGRLEVAEGNPQRL